MRSMLLKVARSREKQEKNESLEVCSHKSHRQEWSLNTSDIKSGESTGTTCQGLEPRGAAYTRPSGDTLQHVTIGPTECPKGDRDESYVAQGSEEQREAGDRVDHQSSAHTSHTDKGGC